MKKKHLKEKVFYTCHILFSINFFFEGGGAGDMIASYQYLASYYEIALQKLVYIFIQMPLQV